jgi:hypothetical protein
MSTAANLYDLWGTPGFPHRGWDCVDIIDLNTDELPAEEVDYETCEACGQHPIRFAHVLVHDRWEDEVRVGCVCSEKLTGDYVNPKRHEAELRRRAVTRARWITRKWGRSAKGNARLKVRGHHITVFPSRFSAGFCYSIDGHYSRRTFPDERAAKVASYDGFLSRQENLR